MKNTNPRVLNELSTTPVHPMNTNIFEYMQSKGGDYSTDELELISINGYVYHCLLTRNYSHILGYIYYRDEPFIACLMHRDSEPTIHLIKLQYGALHPNNPTIDVSINSLDVFKAFYPEIKDSVLAQFDGCTIFNNSSLIKEA